MQRGRPSQTSIPLGPARRMYESGLSLATIARKLNVVHTTLWYALKKYTPTKMRAANRHKIKYNIPRQGIVDMKNDPNINSWFCRSETLSGMMKDAIRGHIECSKPDVVLNIETHLFNSVLEADSCWYDLDIGKDVWLNKQRWSRLIKEYIPSAPLDRFISQAKEIITGGARLGATATMQFRDPDRYNKKHRWGGCLIGATFRGDNKKGGRATITFFSRTTYIGYMGLLDASIAHVMARQITEDPSEIAFRWHITSQQLHCFKTLPYIFSQPALFKSLERFEKNRHLINHCSPTWKFLAKWYFKIVDGWENWDNPRNVQGWLETEKYGPFRRIKRRWAEHCRLLSKNVPPSLKVDDLGFEKAV